ncbi:hypothetical protein JIQ42_00673 [Leishmania sp. Namibia]|uniref:hypothetical protein n=1 Tax=Leishmania sp. Namibia TaxID=2802991 RepID=UPI001B562F35|nr:hypothetical protein JIQ42_00673 [Leishmania sp. Namibia]
MRQLTQGTLSRPSTRLISAVTVAHRTLGSLNQTSHSTATFDSRGAEEEITSLFPAGRTVPEAGEHPRQRRRRGNGEADTLLSDIIALGKQVADEQRRSRVSIPASRLRNASLTRVPIIGAPGGTASSLQPAKGSPDAKQVIAPPAPSPVAPVVSASIRERPAVLAPAPSSPREAALPPLQSWTPAFVLTPQNLQAISDAHGVSDIAFTLAELEETLFSPAVEQAEGDASEANAEAPTTVLTPPPPPPPVAPAMPLNEALPATLEPVAAPPTSDTVGATAPFLAEAAASPTPAFDDPMIASPTESIATRLHSGVNVTTTCPLPSTSLTPSERCSPAERQPARTLLATPILRCRMRGLAVEVSMTRPSKSPRELLEALHEAVSFVESLPALPQGPRLVHLGAGSTSTACVSCSFLEPEGWTEVTSSAEERIAVQLLKERLLLRITEGSTLGLRYIAELRTADLEAPLVVRDTAAELLLACDTHNVRFGARRHVPLNGTTEGAVRLSFSGIGVGVFPAPSTVLRLARAVTAMCNREAEHSFLKQTLTRASGRSASEVAALLPVDIVSEVTQHLHTAPLSLSAALLRECMGAQGRARMGAVEVAEKGGAEKAHWIDAAWPMAGRWWKLLQERRRGMWSARVKTPAACSARMASCVTANEVWRCLCEVILSPAADEVSTHQAISDAMHSAPVRRCRQNYLTVGSPGRGHTKAFAPLLPAVVVDVNASSLLRTSVADLASEICDQPADVVLVLSEDVRLQQKLQFLSSLHLTNTGSHHRVTVLLPGDPAEVDECVCLTRLSARLASQQSCCEAGPSKVHPCDPHWLHQLVEVSEARASAVVPGCSPAPHGAAPASLGELYATHAWRRPCVTTRTSSVGLEMSAAVAVAWQRFITGAVGRAQKKALVEQFQRTHLAPLVLLRTQGAGDGCDTRTPAWWTTYDEISMTQQRLSGSATVPRLMKRISAAWLPPSSASGVTPLTNHRDCVAECGVAFLFVLDVACQNLLRRTIDSSEQLNVLSIAALGLDTSAGGLVDVADRVAGDGVETIVFAMEDATTVHGARFASLPLLRWMVDHRLLFYQLTPQTMDHYITCCQERGV